MKQEMPTCGGCRTCEMLCSFHHTGEYNPSVSSIRILEKEGEAGYSVLLVEKAGPEKFACDLCRGLARPLCVKVCREENDLAAILKIFGSQHDEENKSGGSCL
jgi:Fe-S-cluster-containing hydrogenase component 2